MDQISNNLSYVPQNILNQKIILILQSQVYFVLEELKYYHCIPWCLNVIPDLQKKTINNA